MNRATASTRQRRRAHRRHLSHRVLGKTLSLCLLSLCLLPSAVSANQLYTTDGVHIRTQPSANSSISSTVPAGTAVTKTGQSGNWIAVTIDGVSGYIYKDYLSESPAETTAVPTDSSALATENSTYINSTEVNLRAEANSHCSVLQVLTQGETVSLLYTEGNWSRIRRQTGEEGYVYSIYLGDNKPAENADTSACTQTSTLSREDSIAAFRSDAISYAESCLGDTYSQELRDTDGYADCSSLVRDAYQDASGVFIGNTTSTQADTMQDYFYSISSITDASPGDLLYHLSDDHHTGIYLGNGKVLHASQKAGTVTISYFDSSSTYWEYGCHAASYCYDNQ